MKAWAAPFTWLFCFDVHFFPPTFITFIELPSGQSHAKIDQMQIDDTMVLTGSTDRPAPPKKSIGRLHEAPVATKIHCSLLYFCSLFYYVHSRKPWLQSLVITQLFLFQINRFQASRQFFCKKTFQLVDNHSLHRKVVTLSGKILNFK